MATATGSLIKLNVESDGTVEVGPYMGHEPTKCDYVTDIHTERRCMWCARVVKDHVYSMPVEYSKKYDIYKFKGIYCSLNCLQAQNFSVNRGNYVMYDVTCWVNKIAAENNIEIPVIPSVSREELRVFGGTMTYEEFDTAHECRNVST